MDDLMLGGSVDWEANAGRGFKAKTMILGDPGVRDVVYYDLLNQESSIPWLRPSIQSFSAWLQRRFNASYPAQPPYVVMKNNTVELQRPINVLFVARGQTKNRRLINMDEVVKFYKNTHPNINAKTQILEELSVAQQVCFQGIHKAISGLK